MLNHLIVASLVLVTGLFQGSPLVFGDNEAGRFDDLLTPLYYTIGQGEPSAGPWSYGYWDPDIGCGFAEPRNHGLFISRARLPAGRSGP